MYHNDISVCAQKVRIVLAEKQLEWQGPNLNLRTGEQYAPEFIKISPKAVVPVHDGRVINESNAIVEYLDEMFPDPHRARMMGDMIQQGLDLPGVIPAIKATASYSPLRQGNAVADVICAFRWPGVERGMERHKPGSEIWKNYAASSKIPDK